MRSTGAAPPRRRPVYALHSVDNALRLIQMLRDLGEVRVKDAAQALEVAPSTVHRLMSMLVFRGFAVQDESRVYRPGPSIGVSPVQVAWARQVQDIARPHLHALCMETGESANLMMLTGVEVRFLLTAEATGPLHADDRHGFVLPAHASAGGRAILASLTDDAVARLYDDAGRSLDADAARRLFGELRLVRRQGYAFSTQEAERGITSVAAPLRRQLPVAVSLAGPAVHAERIGGHRAIQLLLRARDRIDTDLAGRYADIA